MGLKEGAVRGGVRNVSTGVLAIPNSGVSRWTFEQDVADSWGDNDATNNGATFTTDSAVGSYALDFGSGDNYVITPNFTPTWSEISVSVWVNHPDSGGNYQQLVDKSRDINGTGGFTLRLYGPNESSTGGYWGLDGSFITFPFADYGSWSHIVATANGSSETVYVNGSQVASESNGYAIANTDCAVAIGYRDTEFSDTSATYYVGLADDPRIYSKELSATEVSNLYNTGSI